MSNKDAPPDDFKQTEIGLIPDEWDITTLGVLQESGLLRIQNGFPCGDHNLEGRGVGHLRPMNVTEAGRIDLGTLKFIQTKIDLSPYRIKHGDIIFNNTNSEELVGKTALYEGENDKFVLSNHMTYMRLSGDRVGRYFLAMYLHKRWFDGYYQSICRRHVNQASIGKERIRGIVVPLPPLPEQRAIAHVLSKIQAAAQAQAAIAERARELKRALMAKLFTEGLRGEPLKETEIGLMPESWEVVRFVDVVEIARGQINPTQEPYRSMIHVGPENIESETGRLSATKTNEESGIISGNYYFTADDVLYSKIRPYLNKVALPTFEGTCSADMYPLRPYKDRLTREFVFQFLLSDRFKTQAVSFQDRTGIPKINRNQLGSIPLPIPSLQEQQDIARILQAVDAKIAAAERKRAGLEELFRAMLGELMTGRVRVKTLL
jgi:type I restriction enzyme S subunit